MPKRPNEYRLFFPHDYSEPRLIQNLLDLGAKGYTFCREVDTFSDFSCYVLTQVKVSRAMAQLMYDSEMCAEDDAEGRAS